MVVDKDKVNKLLLEFQDLLKTYRPNNSELQLITTKITEMTQRNILKQHKRQSQRQSKQKTKPSSSPKKKWHKIKVQ
jgi:hypothetical protein